MPLGEWICIEFSLQAKEMDQLLKLFAALVPASTTLISHFMESDVLLWPPRATRMNIHTCRGNIDTHNIKDLKCCHWREFPYSNKNFLIFLCSRNHLKMTWAKLLLSHSQKISFLSIICLCPTQWWVENYSGNINSVPLPHLLLSNLDSLLNVSRTTQ